MLNVLFIIALTPVCYLVWHMVFPPKSQANEYRKQTAAMVKKWQLDAKNK